MGCMYLHISCGLHSVNSPAQADEQCDKEDPDPENLEWDEE